MATDKPQVQIVKTEWHRNGVCGKPFRVTIFINEDRQRMLGVQFTAEGYTAVFDLNLLAQEVIEFGENSWRGDRYEKPLRDAIKIVGVE